MGTTARTLTVVAALWSCCTSCAAAQTLTSDLIHFSTGNVESATLDDGSRVHIGVVAWSARAGSPPLAVTLTSRGLRSVAFFDPAPLLDAPFAASEAALRGALQLGASEELPEQHSVDLPPD